ncbi:ROK family protein [Streptacidiphilus jiangxiensis]|uniref:Sugar kinase of the NBD/HSP70 family, may contain an N-terminal HTH domain n=1 Tax=Streptacidiphilus jiangxiensis TaxID=235985 RepID=A0A1H7W071_STRJI|nr:ROK family protein [Streptacidiphilus jiangxiensis]SEM14886.1 Sugar kinase of the NBD/HSP70 family, may contain an N-terminal HTH domain [Streptacidiphilus jiangxiensis]
MLATPSGPNGPAGPTGPSKPATSATLREINLRTVFDMIRAQAPISRAEVARQTGISKPTVSALLQDLLDLGLVAETARGAQDLGPTYGALFFAPRPEAAHVLALDVGARRLRGAVADLEGRQLAREDVDVAGMDAPRIVAAAEALAQRLCASAGVPQSGIQHAAIGVPGVVDLREGRIWQALNIPALDGFPAHERFGAALGCPLTLENDIHLAALGEQRAGEGRSVGSFCFLSVGTGVGAGLVLRGELHRGFAGAAGELDTVFGTDEIERKDPCAEALLRHAATLFPAGASPASTEELFAMARAGEPAAIAAVDEEARRIVGYLAPVAAVVDVELVVLGGGIGLNADLLLDRVTELLASRVPYPPRVEVSSLGEAAVLTGAVAVATREALEQILAARFTAGHRRP